MFVVSVTVCLFWLRGTFVFSGRNQTFKNEQRKDSLFILFLCLHLGFGIIKGKTQYYEEAVVQAVETMVQNFVTDLLNSIRERGIDTKSTYTVFIGGGAVLLERFLEQADRLGKHTFIRDMKANADGYDLLYRMTQAGV